MRSVLRLLFVVGLVAAAWLDARAYVRAFCEGVAVGRSSQELEGGLLPPAFFIENPSNEVRRTPRGERGGCGVKSIARDPMDHGRRQPVIDLMSLGGAAPPLPCAFCLGEAQLDSPAGTIRHK